VEQEKRLLQESVEALEHEKASLQEQIKILLNSTSWRITKPLRALSTWLK